MSRRFKNMKEVDDYLEKQIKFDDDYRCIIDIIQEKNTCLVNFINSLIEENKQLKEQLQMIREIIQTQITETEEYLQTSIKGGMPTGALYSEIEFLQKLKKECFDE